MGDMKKVGKVGGKALLYFELITTFALFFGILIANLIKPGEGVVFELSNAAEVLKYKKDAAGINWLQFFLHIIPSNIFKAFTDGDILQVLFIAILFGFGLTRMGENGQSLLRTLNSLSVVFFNIMRFIMKLAPLGAFGGMAFTIGKYGTNALFPLAKLMFAVYLTMALFIFVILNLICRYYKFSLWKYLKYIKEEILLVLGTSSSESALPGMMQKMENIGCSRSVVGLVIPTGYSFNLDGTSIYLVMATIFLAQVFDIDLSLIQQLTIIGILMITSKGAAGVTGSGFIVLASTLAALEIIPVAGLSILLGVDRFMSEARAITNLIGNGVATIVIAKSENEFDDQQYQNITNSK